jgi:transposase-like protein
VTTNQQLEEPARPAHLSLRLEDWCICYLNQRIATCVQRYASATWSGDVGSGWDTFKREITAGLDFSASGLPCWTTDTGGFFRPGSSQFTDPAYQERFLRWLEFSTFTPLMRVHGYQTDTEFWHFGRQVESVARKYLDMRYQMLPYLYSEAAAVTMKGSTLLRPLVMDFASDPKALQQNYEFMFGHELLVAPVVTPSIDRILSIGGRRCKGERSMKAGRFTEEQVIGVLKQHEAGRKVAELSREIGVSEATIYTWKSKYGGMEVNEAQRLKGLEEENRRLRQLVADLSLDKEALKAIVRKNGWSLPA